MEEEECIWVDGAAEASNQTAVSEGQVRISHRTLVVVLEKTHTGTSTVSLRSEFGPKPVDFVFQVKSNTPYSDSMYTFTY